MHPFEAHRPRFCIAVCCDSIIILFESYVAMASSSVSEESDTEVWGWFSYFSNIVAFLQELERSRGIANLRYAEYAVERLEVCLSTAHSLTDHIAK